MKRIRPHRSRRDQPVRLPPRVRSSSVARRILPVLATLFAATSLAAIDRAGWKHRQILTVPQPGAFTVVLPVETLDAARTDYGDIRLVDPEGNERAFALQRGSRPSIRPVAVRSFRSTLTEESTLLTIETGDLPIQEIHLETPAAEFIKRALVEISPDGSTWTTAQDGAPLFRQAGITRLDLAVNARFVRITVSDSRSRPVPFTGAKVVPATEPSAGTFPLEARIVRREEFAGESVLTLELAAAHTPLDTLAIITPERLFTRRVSVGIRELNNETSAERIVATGTIFQVATDSSPAGVHTVPLAFTAPSRELLVHIANGDSPPLPVSAVALNRFDVTLTFAAPSAGEYLLLTGNAPTPAPRYDVADLRVRPASARLTPGPLAPNPAYQAPVALAGTPLLGAPLDPSGWRYRKAVVLAAPGVHQLELDLDVLVHAQPGFGDVRLLREGVQVPYLLERSSLSRSIELTAVSANDPKRPRVSRWEIVLPRAGLPLTRVGLTSPSPLFQRQIQVFEKITDDRGNSYHRTLASADWSRTPGEQRALNLPLTQTPLTAQLIVETDNGDNPPLVLGPATATHGVVRLLFKADPAPLALYYGNQAVGAPRYDLALVAGQIVSAEKNVARLAAEESTQADGWTKSVLGSGRGGILFWAVLALVVIALLAIVAKLLPKPPAPKSG